MENLKKNQLTERFRLNALINATQHCYGFNSTDFCILYVGQFSQRTTDYVKEETSNKLMLVTTPYNFNTGTLAMVKVVL